VVGPPPPTWALRPRDARAFELAEGLWQLRLPAPWEHMSHVNAYAVDRADGGIVLIDAGCAGHPSAWETLSHALGLAGRSVADVRDVVITHYHSDHMGLAGPLASETGATVWGHPATWHFFHALEEPDEAYDARRAFAAEHGVPDDWLDAFASLAEELDGVEAAPRPDRELVDGVVVDTALGPLEVLETPGHAPSHVCLLARERGLLFAADLVAPVFTSYGDWGYSDDPIGEYRASIERVANLDVSLVLPGHGRPSPEFPPLVELYRAGFEQRLAEVRDARGASAWEIALEIFGEPEFRPSMVWNVIETAGYRHHLGPAARPR
jgi:glyoxylase-like metal-dependent hydrolase (beta-lactamase superfamily II)